MKNQKVEECHKKLIDRINRISEIGNVDSMLADMIKKSLQNMYDSGYNDGYTKGLLESHNIVDDDFNDDFIL